MALRPYLSVGLPIFNFDNLLRHFLSNSCKDDLPMIPVSTDLESLIVYLLKPFCLIHSSLDLAFD